MARIDWDAIKRDYRTARFTDPELAAKHGVSRETICRRRKNDPEPWPLDLTEAIKQATDAALVTSLVTEDHQKVTDTILAMAEVNVGVLRNQHKRLDLLDGMLAKGVRLANTFLDADDDSAIQALASVTNTAKLLTELERKVFKLDDTPIEQRGDQATVTIGLEFETVQQRRAATKGV